MVTVMIIPQGMFVRVNSLWQYTFCLVNSEYYNKKLILYYGHNKLIIFIARLTDINELKALPLRLLYTVI